MSSLIGVYEQPDPERVERDDEARRAIAKAVGEGAEIVGSFGPDEKEIRCVAGKTSRMAWRVANKRGIRDE